MLHSRFRRHAPVVLALCLSAGCSPAPTPAGPPAIVGAWRSGVQFSTGSFASIKDLEFLYVFNAGGTMTESSNYDQMPPVPPAYGVWREIARNRFEAKYTFFTTRPPKDVASLPTGAGWPPAGHGVLTERMQLATDGRSYESTIELELFDASGKPVPGGGGASAHGVRAGF
jgi:hypothetical protein